MHSLLHRIVRDLKADNRKTLLLVVLAVCFAYLWGSLLLEDDGIPVPLTEAAAVEMPASLRGGAREPEEESPSHYPDFLAELMPFERIGADPFRAFSLLTAAIPEKLGEEHMEGAQGERPAGAGREGGLELACTLTGRGEPYAVLNRQIVRVGDSVEGFQVLEIGEGYVIIEGAAGKARLDVSF